MVTPEFAPQTCSAQKKEADNQAAQEEESNFQGSSMSVSSRNLSQPPHSSPSHDGYKFSVATNSPSKQKQASAVREWDKQSPLSDKQNQVLLAMHTLLSNKQTGKQNEQKAQKEAEVEIENMEQFYSWYNAIDEEYVEEEKYKDRINILNEYKDYCESILTQIKAALDLLRELSDKYLLVSKKTGELHQACESLVLQQVRGVDIILYYIHNVMIILYYIHTAQCYDHIIIFTLHNVMYIILYSHCTERLGEFGRDDGEEIRTLQSAACDHSKVQHTCLQCP